jgi:hypothetical protein
MPRIVGKEEIMGPEHHLNHAANTLGRTYEYLRKNLLGDGSRSDASDIILIAQAAVNAEYNLHDAVRIYKETHPPYSAR